MSNTVVADPYPLQDPYLDIADSSGRRWRFRPLTLGDRAEVNATLRSAWPHPLARITQILRDLDPESRKQVVDHALQQISATGWPVTLDSPFGRALALQSAETAAILAQRSLRDHALTPDQAKTVLFSLAGDEAERAIEVMFELRPFEPSPSDGDSDGKEGGDPKGRPTSQTRSLTP